MGDISLVLFSFILVPPAPTPVIPVTTPKKVLLQAFFFGFILFFKEKENERKKIKDPVSFLQHILLLQHFPQFGKRCPHT